MCCALSFCGHKNATTPKCAMCIVSVLRISRLSQLNRAFLHGFTGGFTYIGEEAVGNFARGIAE